MASKLLLLVAITALGGTALLGVAAFAGLVSPVLAEPFDLPGTFFVADLTVLQQFLVFLVVKSHIAVLGGKGHYVRRHDRGRTKKDKRYCNNDLLQGIHLSFLRLK